ncbi:MAG: cytochrome c family protein [Gallionellaceae bacterium]|jgi:hypothetical protein|nr:cytochrome c family protein [Gallionellaceae bacterium]
MHRFLRFSILLVGMFFFVGSHAAETAPAPAITTGDELGPQIEQPIEFPHFRHAGDNNPNVPEEQRGMEINCMYCHTYARRSMVAGIPPLRKCIGCHQSIESVRNKPRIQKLFEYWGAKPGQDPDNANDPNGGKNAKAVPWKKVHDLPDFVRFNHERHIQRFVFQQGRPVQEACGYCHGDIKTMTVARRQKPLTMGWCAECHQKDHKLNATSTETGHGPNDCFTCHK